MKLTAVALVLTLALILLPAPLVANAQAGKVYRVGYMSLAPGTLPSQ